MKLAIVIALIALLINQQIDSSDALRLFATTSYTKHNRYSMMNSFSTTSYSSSNSLWKKNLLASSVIGHMGWMTSSSSPSSSSTMLRMSTLQDSFEQFEQLGGKPLPVEDTTSSSSNKQIHEADGQVSASSTAALENDPSLAWIMSEEPQPVESTETTHDGTDVNADHSTGSAASSELDHDLIVATGNADEVSSTPTFDTTENTASQPQSATLVSQYRPRELSVFIALIPRNVTEFVVREAILQKLGDDITAESVFVPVTKTGYARGSAYVNLLNPELREQAYQRLQGLTIDGCVLRVDYGEQNAQRIGKRDAANRALVQQNRLQQQQQQRMIRQQQQLQQFYYNQPPPQQQYYNPQQQYYDNQQMQQQQQQAAMAMMPPYPYGPPPAVFYAPPPPGYYPPPANRYPQQQQQPPPQGGYYYSMPPPPGYSQQYPSAYPQYPDGSLARPPRRQRIPNDMRQSQYQQGPEQGMEQGQGQFQRNQRPQPSNPPKEVSDPKRMIYVANVPFSLTVQELLTAFEQATEIPAEHASIIAQRSDPTKKFAFITLSSEETRDAIVAKHPQLPLANGESVTLAPYVIRQKAFTVYVGNLPYNVDEKLLQEMFDDCIGNGRYQSIKISRDPTGRHKGHAFASFATMEDAKNAAEVLNNMEVLGRALRVEVARGSLSSRGFNNSNYGRGDEAVASLDQSEALSELPSEVSNNDAEVGSTGTNNDVETSVEVSPSENM